MKTYVQKRVYTVTNGKHGRISREAAMRAHDAKPLQTRMRAWGEGYWAYEKPNCKFSVPGKKTGEGRKRSRFTMIPIVRDEDGRLRPAEY
jgi:hypothetical protein